MTKMRPPHQTHDFDADVQAIRSIRDAFGCPSISCGVLHHAKVIFTHSDGLANIDSGRSADADTVYLIASCSKAFVTATIAKLDHEGALSWTDKVSDHLPQFKTPADPNVGQRATLIDLCSHGTGLAPLDRAAGCFNDKMLSPGIYNTQIASNLPVAYDFRSRFLYNNFLVGVAGDVLAKVTGLTPGQAVKKHIFDPLGLTRSCTAQEDYLDDNVAIGYSVLDNGSLLPHDDPQLADIPRDRNTRPHQDGYTGLQGASGFVRSSVNEMLLWAKAILVAEREERDPSRTPSTPLRGIGYTRTAQRPIDSRPGGLENSYGLGWFRHMLPSRMLGSIGPNAALLEDDPPVMGRASRPLLTIAHWGEYMGFLAAFYTFPDTQSAVVVLANCSPARGDPADLIAQMLVQRLFGLQPEVDYVSYATKAATRAAALWPALEREFGACRQLEITCDVDGPVGTYENKGLMIRIEIYPLEHSSSEPDAEKLGFTMNGLRSQTVRLRHYHHDVWTFMPYSRDDAVKKGLEGFQSLKILLLVFKRDVLGRIVALEWNLQAGGCEGPAPGITDIVKPVEFLRC